MSQTTLHTILIFYLNICLDVHRFNGLWVTYSLEQGSLVTA